MSRLFTSSKCHKFDSSSCVAWDVAFMIHDGSSLFNKYILWKTALSSCLLFTVEINNELLDDQYWSPDSYANMWIREILVLTFFHLKHWSEIRPFNRCNSEKEANFKAFCISFQVKGAFKTFHITRQWRNINAGTTERNTMTQLNNMSGIKTMGAIILFISSRL